MGEHDDAVDAARAHLAAKPDPQRPLAPLPAQFAAARGTLHVVAEHLLKPKRELETGNEIALCFTPGGFGTPPWEQGLESGAPGSARVEGTDLVLLENDERRVPADDLREGAELLGVAVHDFAATDAIDEASVAAVADWFAFGTVVLAELLEAHPDLDPAPIRLWPEHFDVATELGSEPDGERANYGASPGDDDHPEPYLYVGPWDQSVTGERWNATTFVGAELSYADLIVSGDQAATAIDFMADRKQ